MMSHWRLKILGHLWRMACISMSPSWWVIGGSRSWATYEGSYALVCLLHDESLVAQDLRPPINNKVGGKHAFMFMPSCFSQHHPSGPITVKFHDEPLVAQDLGPPTYEVWHALVCLLHDESLVAQDLSPPINNKAGCRTYSNILIEDRGYYRPDLCR